MVKLVERTPKKGLDLEFLEGTQMNLQNAFYLRFKYFGLTSSLSKSRRVQS